MGRTCRPGGSSRIDQAGVQSAITGTLWVISLTAVDLPADRHPRRDLPGGVRRQHRWYNRLLELNIQNLAGVPSIIFGILGLGIIARSFGLGFTVITAAIVLSLLVLPVVIIATREAIRAVPQSIRQASYALGATKWQTVSRQVLPAAVPGIATGSILALSRAIGEAAPLIVLGAVTFITFNPDGLSAGTPRCRSRSSTYISEPQAEFQELGRRGDRAAARHRAG